MPKKSANFVWAPPSDFEPFTAELTLYTDKDGLFCTTGMKMVCFRGFSKKSPIKGFDLFLQDPKTVMGVYGRFCARTFDTNVKRRLPPNTGFKMTMSVIKSQPKDGDPLLKVNVSSVKQISRKRVLNKNTGEVSIKVTSNLLESTDPISRKLRSAGQLLPSAFRRVRLPNTRVVTSTKD